MQSTLPPASTHSWENQRTRSPLAFTAVVRENVVPPLAWMPLWAARAGGISTRHSASASNRDRSLFFMGAFLLANVIGKVYTGT